MNPLISIIIPCYNQAEFLPDALNSILIQTYSNWECIIVNDGSPDNTEVITKNWCLKDPRFHYVKKENGGISSARNTGIRRSKGTYILPLDADDYIDKHYLTDGIAVFMCQPDVKLVYGNVEKFGESMGIWDLPNYSFESLLTSNMMCSSSIYKKEDYDKTNGYDEKMDLGYEDWEFWFQLLAKNDKVVKLSDHTYLYYRIKKTSRSTLMTLEIQAKMQSYIYVKHINIYEKYWKDPISTHNEILRHKNSMDFKLGKFILDLIRKLRATIRKLN